jgi:4-amino-4-deoxy-L-arabinose transferase-like glycosyltransferase
VRQDPLADGPGHAPGPVGFWSRPDRWSTIAVALVLAVSLALRLAFLAGKHSAPFSDMLGYEQRALLLLREHTFQTGGAFGATYRGPGYIVFLAAIFGLAGHHLWVVYLTQSLLGVATLLGVYQLGARLFSRWVGLIALALAAAYVPFMAYANILLPETLFVCLVVFCVYAVVRGVQDTSPWWLLAGGVLCGCAALTRSVALLLPAAFVVWLVVPGGAGSVVTERPLGSRRVRWGLVAFVAAMVVVLAPWVVRNYADQHMLVPGDTVGGLNLLIGNHEDARGVFDEEPVWSNAAVQEALAQGKREAALDVVFRDQALAWIGSHPGDFLVLTGRRAVYFLSGVRDWVLNGMGSRVLDALSNALFWYLWALVSLALVGGVAGLMGGGASPGGGVAGLRSGRPTLLPLACFFYLLAVVSVFYFQVRYRLPAMPFVILLAAYALGVVSERGKRGVVVAVLAALGTLGLSHLSSFYGV